MHLTQLTSLRLYLCSINVASFRSLCPALASLLHLTFLGLSYNPLGDEGCALLASCLAHLTSLQILHLGFVELNAFVSTAKADPFSRLLSLTELDISGNGFGDTGCIAIVSALPHLTNLSNLLLYCTNLTDVGIHIVLPALCQHCITSSLRIQSGNHLTQASLTALRANLPAC